ncbi:MAG: hypothetical protein ABIA97_05485 [Candidatus Omnitrophota bacterium]
MERLKFINHKDRKILHIDLSDCNVDVALRVIEEGKRIMREQSERSVLVLTNFNNDNVFIPDLFHAMKEFAIHNKPYVKASAVIAYKDIHKLFIDTMAHVADREFSVFDDMEKAKDWLVQT